MLNDSDIAQPEKVSSKMVKRMSKADLRRTVVSQQDQINALIKEVRTMETFVVNHTVKFSDKMTITTNDDQEIDFTVEQLIAFLGDMYVDEALKRRNKSNVILTDADGNEK